MSCFLKIFHYIFGGPSYQDISLIINEAEPGDLISFQRLGYKHYTLYIGDGKVICVEAKSLGANKALISEMTVEHLSKDSYTRIENHDDIAADVYKKVPKNPYEVVSTALQHVGRMVNYELLFRNCEFYCTSWKFGVGFSTQVMDAESKTGALRYERFAEHVSSCPCYRQKICHCSLDDIDLGVDMNRVGYHPLAH